MAIEAIAQHFNLPGGGQQQCIQYIGHVINLIIKALLFGKGSKVLEDNLSNDKCNGLSPIKALGHPRPTYGQHPHHQPITTTIRKHIHECLGTLITVPNTSLDAPGMRPRHERTSACAFGMGRTLACVPDRLTTCTYECTHSDD